jgi:hypothetical protein
MKITSFMMVAAVMFPLTVAAGDKSTTQDSFNKLDQNKDGYISQQEAKENKNLIEQWESVDADADGQLEMSEFSAFESGKAPGFTPPDDPDAPGLGATPMK